jgi:hypothetical protein
MDITAGLFGKDIFCCKVLTCTGKDITRDCRIPAYPQLYSNM